MASPAKKDLYIRLAAAGVGAAAAGPLGAALGGTVGGLFGELVRRFVDDHTARLVEKSAELGGETLSEFFVHYCYDKFQERDEHSLEDVVRQSFGYGLGKVRVSLDADLQVQYAAWFKNWELRLSGTEPLPLESMVGASGRLAADGPDGDAFAALDSLFKRTLERLNGEARSQESIKSGKRILVVGSQHFVEIPEELLRLVVERLPVPFDDRFRDLLTRPENDRAWKTVDLNFKGAVLDFLKRPEPADEPAKIEGSKISVAKLPTVNPLLIGRDTQLRQLDEAWSGPNTPNPKTNLVSIVAFGGVGKTSLAINWWHRNQAPGAERVLGWSFYSQGASDDRQASAEPFLDHALRVWFGVTNPPASSWERGEELARQVQKERTLLILDGLEPIQFPPGQQVGHFKDAGMVALLRELDAHNPGLCVCTSRLPLSDLDNAGTLVIDLDNLTPEFGAQYLETLGVEGPDEELQRASADFDNHALALTLLGSYLVNRRDKDVFQRDTIPSLFDEPKKGGHARRILRQYEHLFKGKPELDVLRTLGLFDRPADKGALKVLRKLSRDAWADALGNLRAARLVEYKTLDGDLDCHPLIREHFADEYRTSKPEEFRATQSQLYEYYSKLAPDQPDTIDEMTPLLYAVYHGCRAGEHQDALDSVYSDRILRGKEAFLIHKLGAFGVNLSLIANFFVTPWSEAEPALSAPAQAWVTAEAAFALRALGRLREAVEPIQTVVEERVRQRDWKNVAISLGNLSELHLILGDVPKAIETARRSAEIADKSGDAEERMINRTKLAGALHQSGDLARASKLFQEAEKMQAERQPSYPILYSVQGYQYCDLLLAPGGSEEVLRRSAKTLAWMEKQGWLLDIALDHLSFGRAHPSGSAEAARHLGEAVRGLRHAGTLEHISLGLLARAAHFRHTREFAKAQHDLDEVRVLATRCGMRLHLTDYHLEQARLFLAQEKRAEALPHYEEAKKLIAATGYHRRDAELAADRNIK
jgi:tetratricopeptide (TPR) repeat protein